MMQSRPPVRDVPLVANARMYGVNERVAELWQRLFQWVADEARVAITYVAHAPPEPIETLWCRSDLGCAFMCGYPFATWASKTIARPRVLAAPLPISTRYRAEPVYCTDVVVRADSSYASIDALGDAPFGFTVEHSQSGFRAPRKMFDRFVRKNAMRFIGPLHTPRGVVDALFDRRIEAGPLDAYWHDLLCLHEPETAARLRTIATTPMTPIPPLVCAAAVPPASRQSVTDALLRVASDPALAELRDALLLRGFTSIAEDDYRILADDERAATSSVLRSA